MSTKSCQEQGEVIEKKMLQIHRPGSASVLFDQIKKQETRGKGNNIFRAETSELMIPSPSPVVSSTLGSSPAPEVHKRNAWGNCSYSDLITKAIMSSPTKMMSLREIYQWIGNNVPYFMDKKDSATTAGWKNSIRHTLSIRKKFVRLPNYELGNSNYKSLWTIDHNIESRHKQKHCTKHQEKKAFESSHTATSQQQVDHRLAISPYIGVSNVFCSYCGQIRPDTLAANSLYANQTDRNALLYSFRRDNAA